MFVWLSPVPQAIVDFFHSDIHLPQVATLIHQHLCEDVTAISEARKNKRSFTATIFPRQPPSALPVAGCSTPNAPTVVPPPDSLPSTALAPHQSTIPPDPAFNPVLPAIQSDVRPGYLTQFFDQNRRLPPTPGPYQSGPGSPFLTPYRFVDCFARFLSTFVSPMPCSQPGHTVRLAIWQLLSLLVAPAKNFSPPVPPAPPPLVQGAGPMWPRPKWQHLPC